MSKIKFMAIAAATSALAVTGVMLGASPMRSVIAQAGSTSVNNAFECSRMLDKSNTTPTANERTYISWEYSPNEQYKFVGRSAGGNESIQLRSKDDSGIITQNTSLYCKQIDVDWNENTLDARVLDIYGKRVGDYSSPADLCGSNELIGSIAKASATSFIIPYAYSSIGVRSHDGAMYLNTITFSWTSYLDPVPESEQSSGESSSSSDSPTSSTESGSVYQLIPDNSASTAQSIGKTYSGIQLQISNGIINSSQFRIYKGQSITLTAPAEFVITNIEFTCTASGTSQYGPGCFAEQDGYSYNGTVGTWSGNTQSVSFTASSNQVRATQINVTLIKE